MGNIGKFVGALPACWCHVPHSHRIRRRRERDRKAAAGAAARRSTKSGRTNGSSPGRPIRRRHLHVHRIKDRIYYEIPKDRLGREFLWVSQNRQDTLGAGYGGQAAGNRVVKWERRGDRSCCARISYDVIADPNTPIARAVDAANYHPIVAGLQHRSARQRRCGGSSR